MRNIVALLAIVMVSSAQAASNINPTNNSSWGANVGFVNWRGDVTNGGVIGEYVLGGFIYGANVGWINLGSYNPANHIQYQNNSATDFGVNFTKATPTIANLRGFAYGANIGWINFENTGNPTIDLTTNRLHGFAYSANAGWINLGELGVILQSDSIAPGIDTDGNGLPDGFEATFFGQLGIDPNADSDGDGESNLSEYRSGTNPTDPNSVVHSARQLNISTRMRVLTNDNVLIGGFIITGPDPKKVILRAIGPSLTPLGVPGALQDPSLELHDASGATLATNDNWKTRSDGSSQQAEIEATTIPPTNDLESALVRTLPANNAAYTAIVRGNGNTTGVAVVEAYDLDSNRAVKLANISTRGFVDTGDNVMIGGFIVGAGLGNNGSGSEKVIVRAIGPSLTAAGVAGALQDPTLELHDGNGATIAFNNNWKDTQQAEIQATGIPPTDDRESAIVRVIPGGAYTAIVRGLTGTTGIAVVEAYTLN